MTNIEKIAEKLNFEEKDIFYRIVNDRELLYKQIKQFKKLYFKEINTEFGFDFNKLITLQIDHNNNIVNFYYNGKIIYTEEYYYEIEKIKDYPYKDCISFGISNISNLKRNYYIIKNIYRIFNLINNNKSYGFNSTNGYLTDTGLLEK